MATEIGGIKLGLGQAGGASDHAIADFFKDFSFNKPLTDFGAVGKAKDGKHEYQDDSGHKVEVFSGKKAKLTAGETSIINGAGKKVIGSKGDDKVLVNDDAGHKLGLGKGNDTVILAGNGANKVDGGAGNDTITVAGAGDNVITGGKGSDTFVFTETATGNNVIKDFKAQDILKIADRTGDHVVKEGEDFTMQQAGKNTVITLKDGGTITLKHVKESDLKQNSDDAAKTDDDGIFHL